jgi:AcrR family transcriptional regulator
LGLCFHDRRRDPQKLRAALINAASTLIAEQGLARVTVDAVAKAAGVTKGGLFHHFPSKQALIAGVQDSMLAQADATVDAAMAADPEPHGSFTRAMLAGVLSDDALSDTVSSRTLCLAMLADPGVQKRWADWVAARVARHAATDDNIPCAVARLAVDGIWLSSLHGGEPLPVSAAVYEALIAMTRPSG